MPSQKGVDEFGRAICAARKGEGTGTVKGQEWLHDSHDQRIGVTEEGRRIV